LSNEESFIDKQLEKELIKSSEKLFKLKTAPSLLFAKEIGNMYTPSLYACLASYLCERQAQELHDARLCLFSYGSGLASAMFSIRVIGDKQQQEDKRFTLENILSVLNRQRECVLNERAEVEPKLYDAYMKERESSNKKVPREPVFNECQLYPGTWYLKSIDAQYRRSYYRSPKRDADNNEIKFDKKAASESINENLSRFIV
jgi:hydroxymethylglutaryl-CoA synthase